MPPCQEPAGMHEKLGKLAPVFGLVGRREIDADGHGVLDFVVIDAAPVIEALIQAGVG